MIGVLGVVDIEIRQQTTDMVGLVKVGIYFDITIHTDGQGLVHKAHPIEIYLDEFRTDVSLDLLCAEQGVDVDDAVEEFVMS